ncbi:HNH endonuclease [bacterium]|nr:HNH endonuclease [bacterium]
MKSPLWSRDELLAVFALYCRLPFGKLHQGNPDVIELARKLSRSPSAVAMKLSNFASFDPELQRRGIKGLKNAGRGDRALWEEFQADPERIAFESQQVFEPNGANDRTIHRPAVPDHFEIESDEIRITEAERTVRVRLVQNFFRKAVLSSYGDKCTICRLHFPELLTASHIIPWSVDVRRRADPRNGLALCAIHDRAFDRGLIGLDESHRLLLSDRLADESHEPGIHEAVFQAFAGKPIHLPDRFLPDHEAIEYHRNHVFLIR